MGGFTSGYIVIEHWQRLYARANKVPAPTSGQTALRTVLFLHTKARKMLTCTPCLGALLVALVSASSVPRNVPVRAAGNTTLGTQYDYNFNTDLRHDGSVFAVANGYTMQVYMDSITYDTAGNLTSFVSNSVAYLGLENGDPRNMTTLGGTSAPAGEHVFSYSPGMWPQRDNESVYSAFWPLGSSATLPDNKTVVMFANAFKRVPPATVDLIYNVMFSIEVVPPETITGSELPPLARPSAADTYYAFWFANEPQFGSFSVLVDREQTYFYAFACDSTGVKMARAPMANNAYYSRSAYQYWNESTQTYSTETPARGDNTTNLFDFDSGKAGGHINSGTVYWSEYHNTYISLMLNDLYGRRVWSTYSTSGNLEGPWADIDYDNVIYTPYQDPRCNGRANGYGVYDFDGKSLFLVSALVPG